jgi:hypothetical protein
MSGTKEHFKRKWSLLRAGLALLIGATGVGGSQAQSSPPKTSVESEKMTTQDKFYCNIKALNPAARKRHKELTDKLIANRKDIVETEKGYEFQFTPANVSLAELADWVAAEGKCCPFFNFHIDLEHGGNLLCLRLTGEEGIKPFIRGEFQVSAK